jgi:hypothetical protein
MRVFILAALLALALLPVRRGYGDTLSDHNLAFTGHIIQETSSGGETSTTKITPVEVLSALAITTTNSKLKFYYDATAHSYVIAPKGVPNGGSATPIATVLSVDGTNIVQWDPTASSSIVSGSANGLNGAASGATLSKEVTVHGTLTYGISFILSGTAAGEQTIMEGKLTDIFHP